MFGFDPGAEHKVSPVLPDYGLDTEAGKVNIGLDAELVHFNSINFVFEVCHIDAFICIHIQF